MLSGLTRKNSSLLTLLKRKSVKEKKEKGTDSSTDMFSETELRAKMEKQPLSKVEEEKLKQQALSKEFENLQPATTIKCVIYQEQKSKIIWDVYIMLILLATTFIIPYRLAFVDEDPLHWVILYFVFDFHFFIDMILCFFTSYTDDYKQIEIFDHKKIAKNYFRFWFTIDFLSIFPFDLILTEDASDANSLIRVARIGKMYKIVRLFRLIKVLKMVKSNKKLVHQFSEHMKISNGLERLILFSGLFGIFIHVFACVFIIIVQMEGDFTHEKWTDSCYGFGPSNSEFETYICSCYFIMTTVSTVGYGDISP